MKGEVSSREACQGGFSTDSQPAASASVLVGRERATKRTLRPGQAVVWHRNQGVPDCVTISWFVYKHVQLQRECSWGGCRTDRPPAASVHANSRSEYTHRLGQPGCVCHAERYVCVEDAIAQQRGIVAVAVGLILNLLPL